MYTASNRGYEKHKLADCVTQEQWAQKYQEAQAAGTRATKLELSGSYDQAFQLYLQAAQAYLFLIRHTSDVETKEKLRTVSSKLVQRAEKIKQARKSQVGPIQRDSLAIEEQDDVLVKSGVYNGQKLPRWNTYDTTTQGNAKLFPRPTLSPKYVEQDCIWKRPSRRLPVILPDAGSVNGRDIIQDNLSDCSVVAALIVSAEHHAKFGSKLGISCLHPQNSDGWPVISDSGSYSVRLCINGIWRRVSTSNFASYIDDQLPTTPSGKMICASTVSQDQLWPALIEKAYLSLSGSYEYPGSNSADDLYALTGWLPEHISLRQGYRSEATWLRLRKAFELGKCVLTVGTGKALDDFLEAAGLVPSHSYAVLDMRERNGVREVEVINPWPNSRSTWSDDLRSSLPGDRDSRTLLVDWEEIGSHFAAIHASWDPTVFDHSDTAHLSVPATTSESSITKTRRHSEILRLRVTPTSTRSSETWFFVARHSKNGNEKQEYIGLQVSRSAEGSAGTTPRLTVDEASSMTDNSYLFYRLHTPSDTPLFDLVISHEGSSTDFSFTIKAFSNDKIQIENGPPPLPYSINSQGSWSGITAGGNHTCSTFVYNPQYRIALSAPPDRNTPLGELEIHAQTSKDTPVNVKLVVSGGKRIGDFETRDVLTGPPSYSYGRQSRQLGGLKPGSYTLIVSSFQAHHEDTFDLTIRSSLPLSVSPIPSEGAGLYNRCVRGVWSEGTDGGSQDLMRNPIYRVKISKSTVLRARLQTPEGPLPIALALFEGSSSSHRQRRVQTTEPYSDLVCGVVMPPTKLEPGDSNYLLIPSTYSPGVQVSFALYVYADAPIDLAED
ncbi:hypothetical protein JCM5353_001745 [Sporobolomyces roseus]